MFLHLSVILFTGGSLSGESLCPAGDCSVGGGGCLSGGCLSGGPLSGRETPRKVTCRRYASCNAFLFSCVLLASVAATVQDEGSLSRGGDSVQGSLSTGVLDLLSFVPIHASLDRVSHSNTIEMLTPTRYKTAKN